MGTKKVAYSVPELAKVLGISKSLVYTLISKNEIPYCRIGEKRILIPAEKLHEWLNQQVVGGE